MSRFANDRMVQDTLRHEGRICPRCSGPKPATKTGLCVPCELADEAKRLSLYDGGDHDASDGGT